MQQHPAVKRLKDTLMNFKTRQHRAETQVEIRKRSKDAEGQPKKRPESKFSVILESNDLMKEHLGVE